MVCVVVGVVGVKLGQVAGRVAEWLGGPRGAYCSLHDHRGNFLVHTGETRGPLPKEKRGKEKKKGKRERGGDLTRLHKNSVIHVTSMWVYYIMFYFF